MSWHLFLAGAAGPPLGPVAVPTLDRYRPQPAWLVPAAGGTHGLAHEARVLVCVVG
jgi:hypothetical protein